MLLISKILADKDENCRHHVIIWINHGFVCAVDICALVIARRGETTHTGVDVNNTHLSMNNSFNTPWFSSRSSVLIYMYIYMYIPYTSSVIGRIYNGSVIQYWRSCTPSRSIRECAVPGLNATFCFLWFTNCVLLFDKKQSLGCLLFLVFVLNILILGIWCSTIPHMPGCFCPWTFFENIGFNTVLTDPFMSDLATQLGYSAGVFQALQLIVFAAFGVVD